MRIGHVISSIDSSTGGPARSVTQLIGALLEEEDSSISLHCRETADPIQLQFDRKNGMIYFHQKGFLGGLIGLEKSVNKQKPDILHGHGLWQMPVHQMCTIAKNHNIPYIIAPRGMLDTWSIQHKGLKKKLALAAYQKKDLDSAAVLHATSESELKNIRATGFDNPVVVIPNGIALPPKDELEYSKTTGRVLFLSRLVPNKGLEELIDAWQMIEPALMDSFTLDIVGEGKPGYIRFLKEKIKKEYKKRIRFHGAVYGKGKKSLYKNADLFVLPTYTENFGIVVAEALSYGVPVITTKGAPWQDLETRRAGWWIEIGTDPLKVTLEEALRLPAEERAAMGKRGRALVEEKYSIEAVAEKMKTVYEWIIGTGQKPVFVY